MIRETKDPAQEFDELVTKYNEWLASSENLRFRSGGLLKNILWGAGSVFNISGDLLPSQPFRHNHPVHSRDDLTSEQKDAIALASDWQRATEKYEKMVSEIPGEEKESEREFIRKTYNNFREIYVSYAKRKVS